MSLVPFAQSLAVTLSGSSHLCFLLACIFPYLLCGLGLLILVQTIFLCLLFLVMIASNLSLHHVFVY